MMQKHLNVLFTLCFLLILPLFGASQSEKASGSDDEAFFIRSIFDHALTQSNAYDWLHYLTKKVGARLSGSPQAAAAVSYTQQMLDTLSLDSVWLQPCMVPHWERGAAEEVRVVNSSKMGSLELHGVALGNSIGTPDAGITAEIVEVKSLDEVDQLGEAGVAGKIVFYNRPLNPTHINTFRAYGGAVDQRGSGASRAARYGAVGVLVRSMATGLDDVPHTGSLRYDPAYPAIPAISITTNDAELLSRLASEEPIRVYMRSSSRMLSDKPSYNVIGEIKGSEHPEEIILVGGHLDSWDLGEGAHDDGTGCVQSMAVLQTLLQLGYRPKRTIRCVLFMNEENGLAGGRTYWERSNEAGEYHMAAIESDRGGFTPRGFTCEGRDDVFKKKFRKVNRWLPLLEPYGLSLSPGGSGADISGLKSQGGLLFGLYPDSQRYFDFHHTDADRFEEVNKRELEMGAAAMTALVYLLDKNGL